MKKLAALLLSLVMALGMVSAAGAEGEAQVFWYTFGDVYLSSVRAALDAAFTERGVPFVNNDANGSQTTQLDQINTALTGNPGALVVNLVESGADGIARNIVDSAKNAGVPVVFFNRAISQDEAVAEEIISGHGNAAFVGTNYEEAGIMQGKMIGEYLVENYDEVDLNGDGVITYVMFKGDETNLEAIARTRYGVEDANKVLVAAGKPELKFYDEGNASRYLVDQNGQWSNSASFEYMTTILSQYNMANNNMVELVIANNDDMALGAVNALSNVGYNNGQEGAPVIPVFGVDATATAQDLIRGGRMTGTIKQDAEGMADAIASIVKNLLDKNAAFDNLSDTYVRGGEWKVTIPYAVYTGDE
ncbi:MAG TPA: galactose ABC transporter substrate-binding protein [Candidatus Limnocylindria bacterium]|nr:galactose ABC transporter substrate-binding protein [Candidatus Limnocylindria bacterium]